VRPKGALEREGDLGELYHQWSKPGYSRLLWGAISWGQRPPQFKTYPRARRIPLPEKLPQGRPTLEEAIETRRSRRNYTGEALSLEELSHLLHYTGGITEISTGFRAAPSAGALYPIELYIVANQVAGLDRGIYHYLVREHALEEVAQGDFRAATITAALGQEMVGRASVNFVLSAIFQRTRWRYQERSYRYILLEAGHMAQNLYLAAGSLGLGACAVGAFFDDELNRLLELDGVKEAVLYLVPVGKL